MKYFYELYADTPNRQQFADDFKEDALLLPSILWKVLLYQLESLSMSFQNFIHQILRAVCLRLKKLRKLYCPRLTNNKGGPLSATSCPTGSAVPQFPNGQPLPSLLSVAQSSGPQAVAPLPTVYRHYKEHSPIVIARSEATWQSTIYTCIQIMYA